MGVFTILRSIFKFMFLLIFMWVWYVVRRIRPLLNKKLTFCVEKEAIVLRVIPLNGLMASCIYAEKSTTNQHERAE